MRAVRRSSYLVCYTPFIVDHITNVENIGTQTDDILLVLSAHFHVEILLHRYVETGQPWVSTAITLCIFAFSFRQVRMIVDVFLECFGLLLWRECVSFTVCSSGQSRESKIRRFVRHKDQVVILTVSVHVRRADVRDFGTA
ncbi:hypothetical protein D3C87_1763570 [compost metagenome]